MTFRRLRTKLTFLYAGLFGVALLLVAIAVVTAVTGSAGRVVRDELAASGAVYEQIWTARSDQLRQGAGLLARDFGFLEAAATADDATVRSALDNLRARQGVDMALIIASDGHVVSAGDVTPDGAAIDIVRSALDEGRADAGVVMIDGQAYQAVAAPILAPVRIGWVVFAKRLDHAQMQSLETLSAIPLSATVMTRSSNGLWRSATGGDARLSAAMARITADDHRAPRVARTAQGPSIVLARPLPSFSDKASAALLLTYPLSTAMKPYQGMFLALGVIGVVGLASLIAGSWLLARSLTRPISALDAAVHRLQQGEHAEVDVSGADEIGRLADSFNAMAGDIRDREQRLTHMALHDQETQLPNRLSLEQRAAEPAGDGQGVYVAVFGIDRFEVVRNAIGYGSMADLVRALGQRLSGLAEGRPIARVASAALGLAFAAADDQAAMAMAERLCEAAIAPIRLNGAPVDVALSAGLARVGADDEAVASPVDRAAIALDQARAALRQATLFDPAAYGDPAGNLSLISELMTALRNGEFSLSYQPKYDFRTDAITGVEALARWNHPRRGLVSPDLFIGMAEETGHIRPLTEWVLRQAMADQKTLAGQGHDLVISINVSGRLLSDQAFADFALAEIEASGARLCFEITETAVIASPQAALKVIDRLAAAGIGVSIDDYGSGLSSLNYLKQIRADELKIDKAFVLSLDQSSRDGLLVKSTIDLAHSLGLKVTAEGVETPVALALLRGMGCDMAQGYLIGRPVALDDLRLRLEQPVAFTRTGKVRKSAIA